MCLSMRRFFSALVSCGRYHILTIEPYTKTHALVPCYNPTALMPALLEQAPKFVYQAPLSVKLDSNGEQKMLKEHV